MQPTMLLALNNKHTLCKSTPWDKAKATQRRGVCGGTCVHSRAQGYSWAGLALVRTWCKREHYTATATKMRCSSVELYPHCCRAGRVCLTLAMQPSLLCQVLLTGLGRWLLPKLASCSSAPYYGGRNLRARAPHPSAMSLVPPPALHHMSPVPTPALPHAPILFPTHWGAGCPSS